MGDGSSGSSDFIGTRRGMGSFRDTATDHVESFLTHLAVSRRISASTQNQALNALVFLFRDVVKKEIGEFNAVRAKRPICLRAVLSQDEAKNY